MCYANYNYNYMYSFFSSSKKVAKGAAAPVAPDCPHGEILRLFGERLPMARQPAKWTPTRQALLRARWREDAARWDLGWWDRFFAYVSQSPFLTGRTSSPGRRPFELSLDWLLKSENFTKTIEGAFEDKEAA